jgi:hypothetical protein
MDPQILGGLLAFFGGVVATLITTGATLYAHRSSDRALERDEIRKRKVEIIYQLLGSRYILVENYRASSEEVRIFNTAMALFSVYFEKDREASVAYDRFITSKSDDNLTHMLSMAAKAAKLDLLDSRLKRVVTVNAGLLVPNIPGTEIAGVKTGMSS